MRKVYVVEYGSSGVAHTNTFASFYEAQRFAKRLLDEGVDKVSVRKGEQAKEFSCG